MLQSNKIHLIHWYNAIGMFSHVGFLSVPNRFVPCGIYKQLKTKTFGRTAPSAKSSY